jgi:hypothetical protein
MSKMLREEEQRVADGLPASDVSEYTDWIEDADPENIELMELFGRYNLGSQMQGMTESLSLNAACLALELDGIPRCEWRDWIPRLNKVHELLLARRPKKPKKPTTGPQTSARPRGFSRFVRRR